MGDPKAGHGSDVPDRQLAEMDKLINHCCPFRAHLCSST